MSETLLERARALAEKAQAVADEAGSVAREAAEALNASGASEAAVSAAQHGPSGFVFQFAIFVLAIFVGYYVVWSVT
ncbi:MAG: NAD(P) transhydrogenase subunit alpha, partial [Phyllobacteriaceae bacterium]|nr:NAD(P) transhydrogenase subunit alpha [Phyllobacteriaceae bacterium]